MFRSVFIKLIFFSNQNISRHRKYILSAEYVINSIKWCFWQKDFVTLHIEFTMIFWTVSLHEAVQFPLLNRSAKYRNDQRTNTTWTLFLAISFTLICCVSWWFSCLRTDNCCRFEITKDDNNFQNFEQSVVNEFNSIVWSPNISILRSF